MNEALKVKADREVPELNKGVTDIYSEGSPSGKGRDALEKIVTFPVNILS